MLIISRIIFTMLLSIFIKRIPLYSYTEKNSFYQNATNTLFKKNPDPIDEKWGYLILLLLFLTGMIVVFITLRCNVNLRWDNKRLKKQTITLKEKNEWKDLEKSILKIRLEQLDHQNRSSRLEVLRKEAEPNMLYGSLLMLKEILGGETKSAQLFIDDLLLMLTQTMDMKKYSLVTIEEELEYVTIYMNAISNRYNNCFSVEIDIPAFIREFYVPPFSLQILVGNFVAHYKPTKEEPLIIKIWNNGDTICVSNLVTKKKSRSKVFFGTGYHNLMNRYMLVTKRKPVFAFSENLLEVNLPILKIK
jgi:two-component system LytT family sensor kinase